MAVGSATESELYLPELLSERAANDPRRIFLHEAETGIAHTYAESAEQVSLWEARLRALGVRSGEPILVMLPTSPTAVFVWIAIARLGAIEVPTNLDYRGRILAHVFNNSRAKIAIVVEQVLSQIRELVEPLNYLDTIIPVGGSADGPNRSRYRVLASEQLTTAAGPSAPVADKGGPRASDVASLFYTSGTTGLSKGVLVTWKQIDRIARWYFPPGSLAPHEVVYAPFPMFHLSGKVLIMIAAITNGSVVLRRKFKTEHYWDDVHSYRCTSTMLLGSMSDFVLSAPRFAGRETSTLDKVVMNPLITRLPEFVKTFGVRVCGLYGSTEVGIPIATGWDLEPAGSCGRICPGYQLRLADENDEEVPLGRDGELLVRTDEPWLMMAGYWGMPEATVEAWRNLWFHTGDIMRCDGQGNYFFVDRIKDMIRRRGENISSIELEREILNHDSILDCAVVGIRGDWTEEEVMVVATKAPGASLTEGELVDFLAHRVAPFMVPRFVCFTDDLPRTETGKVRKQALRDLIPSDVAWDRLSAVNRE
jgi:carnitine-CoA ligase